MLFITTFLKEIMFCSPYVSFDSANDDLQVICAQNLVLQVEF